MSQDIEESRFAELAEIAARYAKAKATAEHLAEFRKSKKAILMREAELAGIKTAALQERDAYANREYIELLEGLKEATEQAESLRWQLEVKRMRFEWSRTKAANKRAEMSLR